ncbi:MAG: hypothetical protein IKX00_00105 [Bacilli bacterium]|nr:hypothetical protein [Bacilli bacterium]
MNNEIKKIDYSEEFKKKFATAYEGFSEATYTEDLNLALEYAKKAEDLVSYAELDSDDINNLSLEDTKAIICDIILAVAEQRFANRVNLGSSEGEEIVNLDNYFAELVSSKLGIEIEQSTRK